jgi:nucleotide-binding universal stress UspA family protein
MNDARIGTDGEARPASRRRVVVAVDGSPGARAALMHALLEAGRRGAGLDVVAAYTMELYWMGGAPIDVPDLSAVRDDTGRRARTLVEEVRRNAEDGGDPRVSGVDIRLVVELGPAASVLVERGRDAELLVVGSRGRGGLRSAFLGSVALHCVTHASCPVVVVHAGAADESDTPRVVVGVDGSGGSRVALAAAIEEAALRGADLDALVSYERTDYWTDLSSVLIPSAEQIHAEMRRRTADLVDDVLVQRGAEAVRPHVRVIVAEGPAGDVLIEHGREATLVVVGSRGHGAFRGLLLGSVALYCAMYARCPVMVVHPDPEHGVGQGSRSPHALAER